MLLRVVIPFTFKTPDLCSSFFIPPQPLIPAYASFPVLSTGMGCWGLYNAEHQRLGVQNEAISYCWHNVLVCMVILFTFKITDLQRSSFYPSQNPIQAYASASELFNSMECWKVCNNKRQRLGVRNGEISYCQHHVLVCMVIQFTFKLLDLCISSFYPSSPRQLIQAYEFSPKLSIGMERWGLYNGERQRLVVQNEAIL